MESLENGIGQVKMNHDYGDTLCCSPPTEEEKMLKQEAEQQECEQFFLEKRHNLNEKRKHKKLTEKKQWQFLSILCQSMSCAMRKYYQRERSGHGGVWIV